MKKNVSDWLNKTVIKFNLTIEGDVWKTLIRFHSLP